MEKPNGFAQDAAPPSPLSGIATRSGVALLICDDGGIADEEPDDGARLGVGLDRLRHQLDRLARDVIVMYITNDQR